MTPYYQDEAEWNDHVHILPDSEVWRDKEKWKHRFREDLVMTPQGLFIVGREDSYSYRRPATQADMNNFFASSTNGRQHGGGVQLPCKVPFKLLGVSLSFFRSVFKQYHREDVLLLYLDDGHTQYKLYHPMLAAAGPGFVDYELPITPTGWTHFGSIHSHCDEPAYQSSTDAADDEKSPGLHIIIGSLGSSTPTLHCIFSHGGHCFPVPPEDVFVERKDEQPVFPEQWIQKVVSTVRTHRSCVHPTCAPTPVPATSLMVTPATTVSGGSSYVQRGRQQVSSATVRSGQPDSGHRFRGN